MEINGPEKHMIKQGVAKGFGPAFLVLLIIVLPDPMGQCALHHMLELPVSLLQQDIDASLYNKKVVLDCPFPVWVRKFHLEVFEQGR